MIRTPKEDNKQPFSDLKSFNKFIERFEADNQEIFENINDLEKLRDQVESDLFKLRDEKEGKSIALKEELETRITNGTYKQYFKDNFALNHKMYTEFKEEILDVYRKNQFDESFISHIRGKNINELMEEFPEPTYCICNKVSEGDMISCEGKYCEYEWFHIACVGEIPEKEAFICDSCKQLQSTYKELSGKVREKLETHFSDKRNKK